MTILDEKDPVEVAADVAELISVRFNIPQNDAMVRFMRSSTFHRILDNPEFSSRSPEEILETYRSEAGI